VRHSAATILLNQVGKDLREIQELLRHKNIRTTVRYTHVGYEGLHKGSCDQPNSVTPQRTRNDRIAASDKAKQSVDDPDHDKLTDLVLEIAAERLSLEADAVLLGQKCPLFCRNEPVTPVGPVNSMRKLPTATKKGKLMAKSRAAYWVLSSLVLPLSGRRVGEKGEIAVAVEDHEC
jgi:hypothetical protein